MSSDNIRTWINLFDAALSPAELERFEIYKQDPYYIAAENTVNPAAWSDAQVKKSVIKFILESLQLREVASLHLFYKLRKLNCPWPELDIIERHINEVIKTFTPKELYSFARHVIHSPWLLIEPQILTDSDAAFHYAAYVLKHPWPEAEPIIMQNNRWAYLYARYVLQRPWPEAEPHLAKEADWAYLYTTFVRKKPWPEAEPVIMNSDWAHDYDQWVKEFFNISQA